LRVRVRARARVRVRVRVRARVRARARVRGAGPCQVAEKLGYLAGAGGGEAATVQRGDRGGER